MQIFYENCVGRLYQPLLDLPDMRTAASEYCAHEAMSALMIAKPKLPRERVALLHLLTELLAASVLNQSQLHRASYYVLSNPISKKVVSLLYLKDKPLRHGALSGCVQTRTGRMLMLSRSSVHQVLLEASEPLYQPLLHQERAAAAGD